MLCHQVRCFKSTVPFMLYRVYTGARDFVPFVCAPYYVMPPCASLYIEVPPAFSMIY
jgi:hypothetical protein